MFCPREVYPENNNSVRILLVNVLIKRDKPLMISYQILIQSTSLSIRYLPRRLESSERLLALKYIIGSPGNLRSKAEAGRRTGSANVFYEGPD